MLIFGSIANSVVYGLVIIVWFVCFNVICDLLFICLIGWYVAAFLVFGCIGCIMV